MDFHFDTKAVRFPRKTKEDTVSKVKPIYQTSAFVFEDLEDLESFYEGKKDYLYTRVSNPNTDDLGMGVADLEGAPKGLATSSGLSAILAGVLSVVKAGDHVVACEDLYGGTYSLFAEELPDFGIEVSFVDFTKKDEVESAIRPNTKLLYTESVTNPLLRVEDLQMLSELGQKHDLVTMVDNTFATPYLLQPYRTGIDLVVHSATKYIGGHSDVTAGVLVGREDLLAKAKAKVINLGTNLSPFEAWLGCRGLKTMSVRMERHVRNAAFLANELKAVEGIKNVYYPEYVSERGNGAMVSIELDESTDIKTFFKSLDWVKIIPTLAGLDTTVSYPIGTSHRTIPESTRQKLGITKQLVRISVGIENENDIVAAFKQAVEKSL
ncbi:trans-sulfuration enzyme family protein [Pseudalkalibacillus hwajinpoensis]|uniref:homocysteine desulfhydrase n=1 Tax=Guptibacillus hwajinpoensis TaxID=208199 RepID=A0A4U1M8Q4_9BACL|nr:aminotransferase class I/II-fold pyridoxal phosphate-dependent enzyme [Pseudalkalibacillus hwajinpoensis]TKD66306.1 aminotransferase class I/II-fold pyridoxal phosphate-dependent enzyme [Pseudalkalibacillus hwajinpoensis]